MPEHREQGGDESRCRVDIGWIEGKVRAFEVITQDRL